MAIQQEYKHSGAIGSAALLVPVGGSIGAVILGFLYGYISVYNPIAGYVSFLITGAFAAGLVFLMFALAKKGKCRNTPFLHAMGGLIGMVAMYVSWVVFIYALINREGDAQLSLIGMLASPQIIWDSIVAINESGWFTIKSWTPSGIVLWVFWGIEALIVVGAPLFMGAGGVDDEVFCERCNNWCETKETFQLALPASDSVAEHVTRGQLEALEALERVEGGMYPRLDVTLHLCKGCTKTAAYQVKITRLEVDKEDSVSEKSYTVTKMLMLSQDGVNRLKTLSESPVKMMITNNGEESIAEGAAQGTEG